LNNIAILDNVNNREIVKYYQISDVVLVPSINSNGVEEATSLSMLEGMSCGKVVLASRIGGMKEVIREGENGIFLNPADEHDIVDKLKFARNSYPDLSGRLGTNARKYVVANHSYVEHARKFLSVYRKALECNIN
jgi:glycosyltransferase involved in cell wall biosynthesis